MKALRALSMLMVGLCLSCGFQARKNLEPEGDLIRAEAAAGQAQELPGGTLPDKEYLLQAGDRLDVFFPSAREQNFSAIIRPDGRITLPLTGDVEAEGLAPGQLSVRITERYAKLLKEPQAQVSVTQFGPQPFYVFGEVTTPSRYDWSRNLDLVQALSMAGGTLRTAELANVVLLRVAADGAYRYEIHDVRNLVGRAGGRPVLLQPRDIVIVPTSTIADVGIWVNQYINTFIPPLDGFLRGRYYWFLARDAGNN